MDAIYPSEIFPTSFIYTGKQGDTPEWFGDAADGKFDPFRYLIDKAHENGIQIHAWLNPYRVATGSAEAVGDGTTLASLDPANRARIWVEEGSDNVVVWIGQGTNGIFLNPARPEARQLIMDGVEEIITKYPDIDGIHWDDYFYYTTDPAFDAMAYNEYLLANGVEVITATEDEEDGGETDEAEVAAEDEEEAEPESLPEGVMNLYDWRRESVNIVVRDTYALIKRLNPDIMFSISPAGNNTYNYDALYADIELWMREPGYADLMIPQVYWGYEHRTRPFIETMIEWTNLPRHEGMKIAIGLPVYKIGMSGDGGSDEWQREPNENQIGRMVRDVFDDPVRFGFVLYAYSSMFKGNVIALYDPGYIEDHDRIAELVDLQLPAFYEAVWERVEEKFPN
jgi:uncharacterized lipoprotein YddW (UPF0748 family)